MKKVLVILVMALGVMTLACGNHVQQTTPPGLKVRQTSSNGLGISPAEVVLSGFAYGSKTVDLVVVNGTDTAGVFQITVRPPQDNNRPDYTPLSDMWCRVGVEVVHSVTLGPKEQVGVPVTIRLASGMPSKFTFWITVYDTAQDGQFIGVELNSRWEVTPDKATE